MLFVAVAAAVPAVAQTGSIQGQIIGHDGKGIEGLTIAIDRIGISQHFETRSDNRGSFFHTGIPTGNYELSIEYGGKALKLNARVTFGGTSTVNFDLRILVPYDTEQRHRVTTTALTVPRKAQEEWQKAFDAKDDLKKAETHLKKALEIAPDFEAALNDLGTIYHRKGQFAQAAELFERALNVNPESTTARVNLGGTLIGLKQYDRAVTENLRVLDVRPDDALAHGQAGLALFNLGKYSEAITHLEKAKHFDPQSRLLPGFFLASALDVSGNKAAAILEYEDFLKTHPRYPDRVEVEKRIRALKNTDASLQH